MGNEKEKQGFYMINRRIGSTIYRVRVYGSETATETMEDKILRLIQSEAANPCGSCGIMESPQMSQRSCLQRLLTVVVIFSITRH